MSRSYCPRTLLRAVSVEAWRAFFQRFGLVFDSPDGDALERNLCRLDDVPRAAARLALHQIFTMGTTEGVLAMLESGVDSPAVPPLVLTRTECPQATAMRTWLEAPSLFEHALTRLESAPKSWWARRDDLPRREARVDDDSLQSLALEISEILAPQGRGGRCTVEQHVDSAGTQYYVCHPDDLPRASTFHAKSGRLVTKPRLETFEIGYAFHPSTGVLETGVPGRSKLRRELEQAFAWTLLDHRLPDSRPRPVYDLSGLKRRRFVLETDPADEIDAVVAAVRIRHPDKRREVVLDSTKLDHGPTVWDMAEEMLRQDAVAIEDMEVVGASFRFWFRGRNRGPSPHLKCDVAMPNTCTLRSQCGHRVHKIHKHFHLWEMCRVA